VQQESGFGGLLKTYRVAAGLSQNALAKRVGVNPAYVNRLESGERRPSQRHYVLDLARELRLNEEQTNRLLEAGGHLPRGFDRMDARDHTQRLVADILGDETIPRQEREEFRQVIALVARRWRVAAE
jgi:transcriptional regulator with XRE-family HTH domain